MKAVNLIPNDQRRGAGGVTGRSDGVAYVIIGTLTGIVALGATWAVAHHDVSSRKGQIVSDNARATTLQNEATALSAYSSFQSLSQGRAQAVESIAGSRFDGAHVMHEVGRVLPSDVDLTAFAGTGASSGPAATPSTATPATGPTLSLGGCTTSQAEVARTMTRLRLMDGVSGVQVSSASQAQPTVTPVSLAKNAAASSSTTNSTACPHPVNFNLTVTYNTSSTTSTPSTGAGQ
jgi:hypothetical protein